MLLTAALITRDVDERGPIVGCRARAADGGSVAVPELADGAAWQPLLDLAGPTGLMPALWSAVLRLELLEPVPPELVDILGKRVGRHNHVAAVLQLSYQDKARRNVDLLEQLDAVATLFAADGLPWSRSRASGTSCAAYGAIQLIA